jgi:putative transposase
MPVNRDFTASAPKHIRTADTTCVPTGEGQLYPAVVQDVSSRRTVGWAMADRTCTEPVIDALEMAVYAGPVPG